MTIPTRRQFLQAGALGLALGCRRGRAEETPAAAANQGENNEAAKDGEDSQAANQVAILNDTHIGEDQAREHPHPANLRAAVAYLLELPTRPSAAIINGDLAMSVGTPGDYRNFKHLIEPLREAGMPLYLTLGNHDDRDEFLRHFGDLASASQLADHRYNGILELPQARLVLLDSLKETPASPGRLGEEQIAWLLAEIDRQPAKPVVLLAHHNPRLGGDAAHFPGGLEDTEALWSELVPRKQVKGYIHGHVHDWSLGMHFGIHIINALASSMVANKAVSTNGWTMATFGADGVELKLHTYLPDHPWNGERKWLYWRPA